MAVIGGKKLEGPAAKPQVEDIVLHPLPGMENLPGSTVFSPDDKMLTFLQSNDGTLSRKLYCINLETGSQALLANPPGGGVSEANLSMAEKLQRERLRDRNLGVTRFSWSAQGNKLLVPLPDGIYVQDGAAGQLRLVVPSSFGTGILDPQLSPDGNNVAFVSDDEVWVVPCDGSASPRAVTTGGKEGKRSHGIAEYISQEEMDRPSGFKWSQDGRSIAFTSVDARHVPLFRIMHYGKADVVNAHEDHPYPFAGADNVHVRLAVAPLPALGEGPRAAIWMSIECGTGGTGEEEYLARFQWLPGGDLVAQVENREQSVLRVLRLNPATGERTLLHTEASDTWVNLHNMLRPIAGAMAQRGLAGGFLWASEKTGFRHLYLHAADGGEICALTAGGWQIDSLDGVDEEGGHLYVTATATDPREYHLYRVPMPRSSEEARSWSPTTSPEAITRGAGRHVVVLDHSLTRFVDSYDGPSMAPHVNLCSLADGSVLQPIYNPPSPNPRAARMGLHPPELHEVVAADGATKLYGALYRPDPAIYGPGPYKTVVSVYGGPHVQCVTKSWLLTVDMRAQFLRSRGFAVWKVDNRGSARRGLAFEGAIKWQMGGPDIGDQVAGVRALVALGVTDPDRVAIYGWSYGGYLSAMGLARYPGVFRAAVAGAPVTSWDGYDTHYTERYMGLPQVNREGYEESAVMHYAGNIRGDLMLVHGMIDENVHFRHTARLVTALISNEKRYELLMFPEERHMPRGLKDRTYMERRIYDFLDNCLAT